MTQEEQAIEDRFKQLYERYKVWPHIPPTEQEIFCKLLLDSMLVKQITLKAFSVSNGLDPKTYKSLCASSVFDTIIKIFEKFNPTEEGTFIRYFSSSYKQTIKTRIKEEFIDTGSQTTLYPLPPKEIKAIKRILEQQAKLKGNTLTYEAKLEYLQTQLNLDLYQAEFVLNPQRSKVELICQIDLDTAHDDDNRESLYENSPDSTSKSSEEVLCKIEILKQIFSIIQQIVSALSTRKDTVERYSIIATWSVILWFDLKRFYTQDELIKCKIQYPFLDKQIISDYYRLGKDFYTESQQLAQAGFFPTKSKVTKYKTEFEESCRTDPILPNLVRDMVNR